MITTTILTTLATLSAGLIYTHADGGFNMPSSDAIDVAPGLDETLEREDYIKRYPETPGLLSDSEIESLGYPRLEPQPVTGGIRGYLAGDYNIPTDAEVDACAGYRKQHYSRACFAAMQRADDAYMARKSNGFILRGDPENGVILDLDIWNPMPEAQSVDEERMQASTAQHWLFKRGAFHTMIKLRGHYIVHADQLTVGR